MDDPIVNNQGLDKADYYTEQGPGSDASGFIIEAKREKFLGGGSGSQESSNPSRSEARSQAEQNRKHRLKESLGLAKTNLSAFLKEKVPSKKQTASAIAAAMSLIASNSPFVDAIDKRAEESAILDNIVGCVDELREGDIRDLRKQMERLVDVRTLTPQNLQKEYRTIALPQEKYLVQEKIGFEETKQTLDRWRNMHKGEKRSYDEVLSGASFDAIVIGESHMGSMGQYENLVGLMEKGIYPSVVGLEIVDEHTPEGKELVKAFNDGSLTVEDAELKYRYDSKHLLTFLRNKQIPIAGVEPLEKDSGWWNGGPKRFKGITDWAVEQVKKGEVPLMYIGDGHTSHTALERGGVLTGQGQEGWRYGSFYLLKERLESEGLKPLTIHLASKTMLADETDSLFARLYQNLRAEDRSKFMEVAPSIYEEIVEPSVDEACFVKISENEYFSVFPDREKPYTTPPKSAWVSAQKFLEEKYPAEFARYGLKDTLRGGLIGFSLAGQVDEIIWVAENTGDVVKAALPSK